MKSIYSIYNLLCQFSKQDGSSESPKIWVRNNIMSLGLRPISDHEYILLAGYGRRNLIVVEYMYMVIFFFFLIHMRS